MSQPTNLQVLVFSVLSLAHISSHNRAINSQTQSRRSPQSTAQQRLWYIPGQLQVNAYRLVQVKWLTGTLLRQSRRRFVIRPLICAHVFYQPFSNVRAAAFCFFTRWFGSAFFGLSGKFGLPWTQHFQQKEKEWLLGRLERDHRKRVQSSRVWLEKNSAEKITCGTIECLIFVVAC